MKSALAVMAMFLGHSEALKILSQSNGYEQEGIQVLVDTGTHIELGIKADTDSKAQTSAVSEMKQEAQAGM